MNRRGFLRSLGTVAAAFTVLPAATTYARRWVKPVVSYQYIINPAWLYAPYEIEFQAAVTGAMQYEILPVMFHRTDFGLEVKRPPLVRPGAVRIGEIVPLRFDINKKPVSPYAKVF